MSLGVVNEQHFWTRLCHELGLDELAELDFETRSSRGAELQKEVASAIATRERDALVTALAEAGVPVAPVLRRSEMVATAPFPPFPIRLGLPERPGSRPDPRRAPRTGVSRMTADGRPPRRGSTEHAARTADIPTEPSRRLAVVTCMDSRIDVFGLFGLDLGDAHVIRNAGGRVTDDVLRSLALSTTLLGIDSVVLMQHTGVDSKG